MAGARSRSDGREAGHLGVGRVDQEQVDALVAEAGEAAQVGDPLVERELVHLEVARVQDQAGAGADRDGEAVGDRVVDGEELEVERARASSSSPSATSRARGVIRCSLSFALISARVSREPMSGMSARSCRRYGHAADVVLVAVGQHDADDASSRSRIEVKSGRITSMPGWCSSGKSTPQSTMSSLPCVLEHGHVAADLAEPAQADDAEAVRGQGAGLLELGMGVAHGGVRSLGGAAASARRRVGVLRARDFKSLLCRRGQPWRALEP